MSRSSTPYAPAPGQFRTPILDHEGCRRFFHLDRDQKTAFVEQLEPTEARELQYLWEAWARQNQLPPPDGQWVTWVMLGGRGMGKTRGGAEFIRSKVERGEWGRIALVARTAADVRDVMLDGESGLMAISHPDFLPKHEPTRRRLVWPNGAIATTFSAEEPNSLRGPQHDGAWCDELCAWKYLETWDQLLFGLRLGTQPQVVVTTTPRPIPLLKSLIKLPTTRVTSGTTYENLANLAPTFFEQVVGRYQGTHLGAQELEGQIVGDMEGALWTRDLLERTRVTVFPSLVRIVVGVDPAVTSAPGSDETGIVVAGLGEDGHVYILADYTLRATPNEWAKQVVAVYYLWHADRIIGEVNNGGDLIETVLRTVSGGENVAYKKVSASTGKAARAEPIVMFYEQGRAHHVGMHAELEDELCSWVQGMRSPNRLDALVWAATELALHGGTIPLAVASWARAAWHGVPALSSELGQLADAGEAQTHTDQQQGQEISQQELDRRVQLSTLLRQLGRAGRIR